MTIGSAFLGSAALLICTAAVLPYIFPRRSHARILFCAGLFLQGAALLVLARAFAVSDFTLDYVFRYSSLDMPFFYRLSAVWAGQEGSFLLWSFFVSAVAAPDVFREKESVHAKVLLIAAAAFAAVSLTAANPFVLSSHIHADGLGLKSVLRNPWMVIHPPVLFLGYSLTLLPFARAFGILVKDDPAHHLAQMRRTVMLMTGVLGAGILLGGIWAYETLGWGGFWGWDPVENSSLVPWLLSVALIHGLLLQKRSGGWIRSNIFLSVSIFVLVLFSSFLTRSGILSSVSVHSFGESALALPLGFLTGAAATAAMIAAALKGRNRFPLTKKQEAFREIVFGTGITALIFYAFIILAATLAPVFSLLFTGSPSTVKIGFFNSTALVFAVIFLISCATSLSWKKSEKYRGLKIAVFTIITGAVTAAAVGGTPLAIWNYAAAISAGSILSIGMFIALTRPGIEKIPSLCAHAGFALFVAGTVGYSMRSDSSRIELPAGKPASINSAQFSFAGLQEDKGRGLFLLDITRKNKITHAAIPFERMKDGSISGHAPYIIHGIYEDLYLYAEGFLSAKEIEAIIKTEKINAVPADTLLLSVSRKRLLIPVWLGGALIMFGTIAGFFIRRKRG